MQPENTKTLSDLRGIPPRSLRSRLFSASRFRNSTAVTMNLPQHPERPALKSNLPALRRLRTEQSNDAAHDLDQKSSLAIPTLITAEDATVALTVPRPLPRGARTIALTCNPNPPLERAAHFAIVTQAGPEVLAGSSRMKAGTAHKMVLNMISTAAMTRLGYVYGNLMVNVAPKNEKLLQRAIAILERATGADREAATHALKASGNRTPVALVMLAANVSRAEAIAALKPANGH